MNGRPRYYDVRLDAETLRRAMRLVNANAALWAVGNGLVSTLLVIYLANELGATGVMVSLILAAPRFAGLLRLAVPALIRQVKSRKAVCTVGFAASTIVLLAVPAIAVLQLSSASTIWLSILVTAWCGYKVLEYVAAVALWSWIGDLTPRRIRGRLLGRREQWQGLGRLAGMAISIALALVWAYVLPTAPRAQPLALSAVAGAVLMMAAVVPLVALPAATRAPSAVPHAPWRTLGRALLDPAYRRLIVFWFWFSIVTA